jgi:hypothetical protein
MTPKEKAIELINSYRIILMNEDTECGNEILCTSIAKQCALIAVDEIIKNNLEYLRGIELHNDVALNIDLSYWQEVKQEIELL